MPFDFNYLIVYDRDSNWSLVRNVTIGYTNAKNCIPY
jgi:hypothetical protein